MLVWVEVTNQLGISQPWPLRPQFVLSFQGLVRFLSRELSVCSGGFPSCCRCCCSGRPLIFWCLRHVWLSKDMEKRSTDLTALIWASLNPVRHRNFMSFVSLVLLVHRRNMVKIHGQNMSKRQNSVKKSVLLVISISFPMIVSWISPWQLSKESMASKPMAAIGFGLPRSCLNFRPRWQSAELHISSRVSIPRKARLPLLEMPIFPRTEKWPDRYRQINPVTSTQVPVAQAGVARRHYSCNGCGRVQLRLHWGLQ